MVLIRRGIVTTGSYSGGEYYESEMTVEAEGNTIEELEKDMLRLEKVWNRRGSEIDFGFVSGKRSLVWDKDIWEKKLFVRENLDENHRDIKGENNGNLWN